MAATYNCIIMGAAGRDFHDFQTFFRDHPEFRVCAFTATQIPFIDQRAFPRSLAPPGYAADIPIFPESELPELIRRYEIDFVFLAYSDLPFDDVMHKASLAQSCGAGFALLGPRHTQLASNRPVIAVTAVRTGAGKSPLAQWLARRLTETGRRVAVVRHPMPYGDLTRQRVERFAAAEDLDRFNCTIEEREEYEPYIEQGLVIFAGVDYARILEAAEAEADVILWDGGNNDYAFFRPRLSIVVADALRPGHETAYYAGETNFRSADILVINKADHAEPAAIEQICENARRLNPRAVLVEAALDIAVADPQAVFGRRVLVVEDGPTLTHGGMSYGAGRIAARRFGAAELIDPRPHAVGSIAAAFRDYPHLQNVLPALGYSSRQRDEMAETIRRAAPDLVIDASPARIDRLLDLEVPVVRVGYTFRQTAGPPLWEEVERSLPT